MSKLLDFLPLLIPVIILDFGLKIYCIVKIFTEGVANLSKWGWFFIVLLVNLFGSIAFLIAGRKKDYK